MGVPHDPNSVNSTGDVARYDPILKTGPKFWLGGTIRDRSPDNGTEKQPDKSPDNGTVFLARGTAKGPID